MESTKEKSWITNAYDSPYIKSLRTRFWRNLLVVCASMIAYVVFREHFDNVIVGGIMTNFPKGTKASCIALVALGYVTYKVFKPIRKGLLPTSSSVMMGICIVVMYLGFIRWFNAYRFYVLDIRFLHWLYFADILVLYILYWSLDFRSFKKKLTIEETGGFKDDAPIKPNVEKLQETVSALTMIGRTIEQSSTTGSFSIALFAKWGHGKSTFIKALHAILETNKDANIVIEFNPWKAVTTDKMLEDFFDTLAKALKPYNSAVASDIRRYGQKIFSKSKELSFHIGEAIMDEIIPEGTLKEKYDSINESIAATGKRLIVFIDDMDRMTGTEIMQVFRIIRNTANFDNVFYITALDHDYVVKALENTKTFSYEADYLKKIFQLVVSLPIVPASSFLRQLEVGLLEISELPEVKDDIRSAFYRIAPQENGLFTDEGNSVADYLLDNFRDVKRVVNSFKIVYPLIRGEVETSDLLLLELIKNKNYSAYQAIVNKKLLTISDGQGEYWSLDTAYFEKLVVDHKWDPKDAEHLKSVLQQVIEYNTDKSGGQFAFRANFKTYMAYQLFDQIPRRDFAEAMKLEPAQRRRTFNDWVVKGLKESLDNILDQQTEFETREEWLSLIKTFLVDSNNNTDYNLRAQELIRTRTNYLHLFDDDTEILNKAIIDILLDGALGIDNRAFLASKLLEEHDLQPDSPVSTPEHLKDIIFSLFNAKLTSNKQFDNSVVELYLLNKDKKSTSQRVYMTDRANQRMFEYLTQDNSRMKEFLNSIVRSYMQPNMACEFALMPFTTDIFGGWDEFEDHLKALTVEEEHLLRIKEITLKGVQEYKNGRKNFQVSKEECDWLIEHLVKNKQYSELLRNRNRS